MVRQVLNYLKTAKFYFLTKIGTAGETDYEGKIWLNPNNDILPTAIHEAIHCLRPNLTEEQVIKKEASVCHQMRNKDWRELLEIITANLRGGIK
jgi:hypothetical protein